MVGLSVLLFFSVTGITLNHPDWAFGSARSQREFEGQIKTDWLAPKSATPNPSGLQPAEELIAKLETAEYLRRRHGIKGVVEEFRVDDRECMVSFKGPGYAAEAFIDRATGRYKVTEMREGLVAVLNDLHKGRHTGRSWAWVIDLSAAVIAFLSFTGLLLLFYIKRRRFSGLAIAAAALGVVAIIFWMWVP